MNPSLFNQNHANRVEFDRLTTDFIWLIFYVLIPTASLTFVVGFQVIFNLDDIIDVTDVSYFEEVHGKVLCNQVSIYYPSPGASLCVLSSLPPWSLPSNPSFSPRHPLFLLLFSPSSSSSSSFFSMFTIWYPIPLSRFLRQKSNCPAAHAEQNKRWTWGVHDPQQPMIPKSKFNREIHREGKHHWRYSDRNSKKFLKRNKPRKIRKARHYLR